ncbi:MAG: hypoxanthine/guanine phosphoribosyltransferase [Candidatus Thermoplasmatota archaeon]
MNRLEESLKDAPVVKKGEYSYVIHPITDGIPEIKPDLLEEVGDELYRLIKNKPSFDKIVTLEAMGIPLASVLSLKTGKPFTIIRKRSYGLPEEISVEQMTGYSKSRLFINGLKKDDRVVLVDDVLSTGGSLRAVLSAFKKIGVKVVGVLIAVNKGNAAEDIIEEFDADIDVLVDIDVVDEEVVIK